MACVLLATSFGPGKEYALSILAGVLPRLTGHSANCLGAVLTTFDAIPSVLVGDGALFTHERLTAQDLPASRSGRLARMREAQRHYFLRRRSMTHLYWHDSDMVPPDDIIERLLALDAPVASGIYNVRGAQGLLLPVAGSDPRLAAAPGGQELVELEAIGTLIRPYAVGMGCLLLRRDALESTPFRDPGWFRDEGMGEDVRWCLDWLEGAPLGESRRPVVDLALACWHIDADGTGTRPQSAIYQAGVPQEKSEVPQPAPAGAGAAKRRVGRPRTRGLSALPA